MHPVDILSATWATFWQKMAQAAPGLLAALIVLLVGSLLARWGKYLVAYALNYTRFEILAEKSGIDDFLEKGGINLNLGGLIAGAGYWLIILLSILVAANILHLDMVAELFNKVTLYMPNVLVAILILVFGAVVARIFGGLVLAFARNIGIEGSQTMASFATYTLMVLVIIMALGQLKIDTDILASTYKIALGAIGLAFGLAFGLGGRDMAAQLLGRLQRNLEGDSEPETKA